MTNPKSIVTSHNQRLHPGDQVAYVSDSGVRAHTMLGEITVTFSPGSLRVARIVVSSACGPLAL